MSIAIKRILKARAMIPRLLDEDDLEEVCYRLRTAIGQSQPGVEAYFFENVKWLTLSKEKREEELGWYLDLEAVVASRGYLKGQENM